MVISPRLYHEAVFHRRGRLSGMGLDWVNQPSTFKSYEGAAHFALPRDMDLPRATLWQALRAPAAPAPLRADALGAALFHAAGLTRASSHRGRELLYRACPSAGALYPCEVYLAWPGSGELPAGLFHYDVSRHGLSLLRPGFPGPQDLGLPANSRMPGEALVFVTAIFFRSAWKYRARAYRYLNLDAGHVCEGLVLGFGALGAASSAELDFDDARVAAFLGLDPDREGCLCVVRAACGHDEAAPGPPGEIVPGAERLSRCAALDPVPGELARVHAECANVQRLQAAMPSPAGSRLGADLTWAQERPGPVPPERIGLFTAMAARRSRRNFIASGLSAPAISRALATLGAPLYARTGHPAEDACGVGLLAGGEAGLAPGHFILDRRNARLGLRRDGNIRPAMAHICLDQLWMRDAAVHVLFFADFSELDPCLGSRGYRAALQNAGRLGHRLYLAAESLGLGACGVGAFYDDEAAEVLGLPSGAGLLYLMAAGPVRG